MGWGQTGKTTSWIWQTVAVSVEDGADPDDRILRSEWCRSRARAKRSEEEVKLLMEEMRRTLEFFSWRATVWRECSNQRDVGKDTVLQEGLIAYARDQERLQYKLVTHFKSLWAVPLAEVDIVLPTGDAHVANDEGDEEEEEDEEGEMDEEDEGSVHSQTRAPDNGEDGLADLQRREGAGEDVEDDRIRDYGDEEEDEFYRPLIPADI